MLVYVKWSVSTYEASKNGGQMFSLADMEVQSENFLALSLIILQFFLIAVCRKYVLLIQNLSQLYWNSTRHYADIVSADLPFRGVLIVPHLKAYSTFGTSLVFFWGDDQDCAYLKSLYTTRGWLSACYKHGSGVSIWYFPCGRILCNGRYCGLSLI